MVAGADPRRHALVPTDSRTDAPIEAGTATLTVPGRRAMMAPSRGCPGTGCPPTRRVAAATKGARALTDDDVHGPIDFVLLEFPDQEPTGAAAAALLDLVADDTIRLYDLLAIRKGAGGDVEAIEISELGGDGIGFADLAGARSGLLGDDDVTEAAAALEPGTIAVLLVYENRWAVPFVRAALGAGGQMVASARIPAEDVMAALDALETAG